MELVSYGKVFTEMNVCSRDFVILQPDNEPLVIPHAPAHCYLTFTQIADNSKLLFIINE
jgi:hypothetical protein